jgi:hypothetical protein
VQNNPLNLVDPSGFMPVSPSMSGRYWSAEQRINFVKAFFKKFSGLSWYEWMDKWYSNGFGYGRAIVDFMNWENESGRLSQSDWWRNVNGVMIDDMKEAWKIWENKKKKKDRKSNIHNVQAWLNYMLHQNQANLWTAHNASIEKGFNDNKEVLKKEPNAEQIFAILVTYRVTNVAPKIPLMSTMDPFLDWLVRGDYFKEFNYPDHYPATFNDGASVTEPLWDLDPLFKLIGVGN